MIKLFRAISLSEKTDFDEHDVLRTAKNTLEAKQFFKSRLAVHQFVTSSKEQQYDPSYEYLLIISIDEVCFNNIPMTEMELDGFDAINIHEDNLLAFNNCVKFVKQEAL